MSEEYKITLFASTPDPFKVQKENYSMTFKN